MEFEDISPVVGAGESQNREFLVSSDVCAWCNSQPPSGEALKRCCGCNTMKYCGKQCQAAAWPKHRALCRSRNLPAGMTTEVAGYPTGAALAQAVKEWCLLHRYSINILLHASLRLSGGVEASLRKGRLPIFVLSSQRAASASSDANQNPARAFSLRWINIKHGEHARQSYVSAEGPEPDVEPTQPGSQEDYAGTTRAEVVRFPVLFAVEHTVLTVTAQYPVRPTFKHPDDSPLGEEMTAVFNDLSRLFSNIINEGVVIRSRAGGDTTRPPHSGCMVQTRRGWRWQEVRDFWQRMDTMMPRLRPNPFQTMLTATHLLASFLQW